MSGRIVYVALQQFCEESDAPRELLERGGFALRCNTLGRRLRPEEMPALLQDADAVLAGVEPYSADLLARLPKLRCISRCGIGTDAIDLAEAKRLGIRVCATPEEVVEPVAEMAVAMMLALARNLPLHQADARQGLWKKRMGALLSEWVVGLVGFGRIGQAVERLLRPFAPRVLIADPACGPGPPPAQAMLRPLPELLAQADLVSLHAGRPAALGPLIGRAELAAMKPGSRLVNTARGYLVDEAALLEALTSGHLAGAALDVFEDEPYAGPLAALPQVIATPHVATLTRASRAAMERRCAQNVVEFFARQQQDCAQAQAGRG